MFEPFRCEDCVHGWYDYMEGFWRCIYDLEESVESCEEFYEEDERM